MGVAEDLDLYVVGLGDEFFDVDRIIAKGTPRFALRRFQGPDKFGGFVDKAHAFTAPTGRGL